MLEAAERAGVVHQLGTEFRYSTGQALATRAIRDGIVGEPRVATFMFHVPVLADPAGEVPGWWGREEQGGGWTGAYGSHVIDQMRTMLGEFSGLSASVRRVSARDWTADDTYTVHFRTRGGAEGVLQSSAGGWGPAVVSSRVSRITSRRRRWRVSSLRQCAPNSATGISPSSRALLLALSN